MRFARRGAASRGGRHRDDNDRRRGPLQLPAGRATAQQTVERGVPRCSNPDSRAAAFPGELGDREHGRPVRGAMTAAQPAFCALLRRFAWRCAALCRTGAGLRRGINHRAEVAHAHRGRLHHVHEGDRTLDETGPLGRLGNHRPASGGEIDWHEVGAHSHEGRGVADRNRQGKLAERPACRCAVFAIPWAPVARPIISAVKRSGALYRSHAAARPPRFTGADSPAAACPAASGPRRGVSARPADPSAARPHPETVLAAGRRPAFVSICNSAIPGPFFSVPLTRSMTTGTASFPPAATAATTGVGDASGVGLHAGN